MGKEGSGQKSDDADDLDKALELFIQSMDFGTVPGTNQGWWSLFVDVLTYALFRVFCVRPPCLG